MILSACQHFERLSSAQQTGQNIEQTERDSSPLSKISTIQPTEIKKPKQEFSKHALWQQIISEFKLTDAIHERIEQQKQFILRQNRLLKLTSKRADPYLHLIYQQIKQRELPTEVALMPIIESAYRVNAYSHGQASGLWQITPITARHLKLKRNWWYDGRRDISASTTAALDYLIELNQQLESDWLLTFAAYNSGLGTVFKAIKKNQQKKLPTDFWSLKLPKETMNYVPRLLAIGQLLAQSETEQQLYPTQNKPVLSMVDCQSQIDLAVIAKLSDYPIDKIYQLNPGFNQWATPPNGPHHILLPIEKANKLKQKLPKLSPHQRIHWTRYQIKSGDTLSQIARKFSTKQSILKQVNHMQNSKLRTGKYLLIPTSSESIKYYQSAFGFRTNYKVTSKHTKHRVESGESYWTIAKKYGISVAKLCRDNHRSPKDILSIGEQLRIKVSGKKHHFNARKVMQKIVYRVRQGDSLYKIAQRFKVSMYAIREWNQQQLQKSHYLQPGQKLKIVLDVIENT